MRASFSVAALALTLACGEEPVRVQELGPLTDARAQPPPAEPPEPRLLELEGGLVVEVLEPGRGPAARRGGEVRVHYRAHLAGEERAFDSSWSRGVPDLWSLSSQGRPRLIEGLVRGLAGRREGSRVVLRIPAALGWGAAGFPAAGVPPDADLVYEVLVLEVR